MFSAYPNRAFVRSTTIQVSGPGQSSEKASCGIASTGFVGVSIGLGVESSGTGAGAGLSGCGAIG